MSVRWVPIRGWEKELGKRGLSALLGRIGNDILSDAQSAVPVKTGRLRNSLKLDVQDDAVAIGTDEEYGKFVEDGTSRSPAQPFLRPALYKRR